MEELSLCIVGAAGVRAMGLFKMVKDIPGTGDVAGCDPNVEALKERSKDHGLSRTYPSYDEVLADKDIDIVVLATPDNLHGPQTLAAIESGKHVYVEVPMCDTTVEDCIRIVKAAERHNAKVQMGNQTRWWPSYYTLRQYVAEGRLGDIIYAESEYWHNLHFGGNWYKLNPDLTFQTDRPVWQLGFGHPPQAPLSSGGMHALDSLRWVLGEEFCEATACCNDIGMVPCRGYTDEASFTVALLKTPSNAIARVSAAFGLRRRYSLGAAVYGTRGSLEMDRRLFSSFPVEEELGLYLTTEEDMTNDHRARATKIDPIEAPYDAGLEDPQDATGTRPGAARIAFKDLVDAVHEDRQPLINVYEGARSSAAAICSRTSYREHRPVHIPPFHQRMK